MSLALGANTLTITGYAASGATTTYTTTITRAASSVSTLSGLTLNNGLVLSPSFAAATTTYTVAASSETSTAFFTPTWIGVGETATATFGGFTYPLVSGVMFDMPISLIVGATVLYIDGYAANGSTTRYSVTVNRAASSVSTLTALTFTNSNITLAPTFNSSTVTYAMTVPFTTSSTKVTGTWNGIGETATATFGGSTYALTSGTILATAIPLNVGENVVTVTGYAQNGSTSTYTVTITRTAAETVSTLSALTFSNSVALSPSFASDTVTYSSTVPFTTSTTQLTGTWTG
jgi:hypothetical protein